MTVSQGNRGKQQQAEAEPLGAADAGLISTTEVFQVHNFKHAPELDTAVAAVLPLFPEMAGRLGANFQGAIINETEPAGYVPAALLVAATDLTLADKPGAQFLRVNKRYPFARFAPAIGLAQWLVIIVALHQGLHRVGPQVKGIVAMREER